MPTQPQPASSPARARSRLALRWYTWFSLVLGIACVVAVVMHWDDRGLLWVAERFAPKSEQAGAVWLPHYRVSIDAKALPGMEDDEASDVSYDPATKTLFSVMGKNPFLVQLTLEGDVLRKIPLNGWSNPEAVTVMGNGRLAIVDERNHLLSVVTVDDATQALDVADFPKYDLGPSANQNKAFEAVAWDAKNQRLLLGEERPARLFSLKVGENGQIKGEKQPLDDFELDMRNLSALAVDPRTGHILALSADSHLLLELNERGEQVSFITLLAGFNGFASTVPRAEGVTIDDQGTLYLVSEPNFFYALKKSE